MRVTRRGRRSFSGVSVEVQAEVERSSLTDYLPVSKWVEQRRGGEVLRTEHAVFWFIRQHKQRLIDRGVLIVRKGPGGHLLRHDFGEAAVHILRDASDG